MEKTTVNSAGRNRLLGVLLMILALFGFFVIVYRIVFYRFEFDPQYSTTDYGRFNILSYFTVQSNFFIYVYFLFASLSVFNVEKARRIGFSPVIGALATTYVIVAGVTYCAGIPMGMTPPFKWDTPYHSMLSFIQVYYHMIIPPFALALWFFPFTNEKISRRVLPAAGIYPLVYSVFSVIRGAVSDPTYYPYPFYNPEFLWGIVSDSPEINYAVSYLIMLVLLVFGISVFIGLAAVIRLIHNRRIKTP